MINGMRRSIESSQVADNIQNEGKYEKIFEIIIKFGRNFMDQK